MQNRSLPSEIQPGGGKTIGSDGTAPRFYNHESQYISTFTFLEEGWLYSNGGQTSPAWPEGGVYIAAQVESGANGDLAGIAGLGFWDDVYRLLGQAEPCDSASPGDNGGSYYPSQLSKLDGDLGFVSGSYPPGMNPGESNEHQIINFSVTHPNRGFFKMNFPKVPKTLPDGRDGWESETFPCPNPEPTSVNFGTRSDLNLNCCPGKA